MHQETLLYMWHRLPLDQKRAPAGCTLHTTGTAVPNEELVISPGAAQLGASRGSIPFGWDNEFGPLEVNVDAFVIDRRNVTNAEFLEFLDDGGYSRAALWSPGD